MFRRTSRKLHQRRRVPVIEPLEDRRLLAGLAADGNQVWQHALADLPNGSVPAVEGVASLGDQFGNVLAVGDFNGDLFPDLAIGATKHEQFIHAGEGEDAVNVLYGSASGLTTGGNQLWNQDSPGLDDQREAGDRFGHALAAGDLNGDGYDDLAIGVPGEDLPGATDAGAVHILLGSAQGLTGDASRMLRGGGAGGQVGRALAIGDMNNDGVADLAIGRPGAFNGRGQVSVYYSGAAVTGGASQTFQQFGGGSGPEDDDRFGFSLAMGDFDRDGFDDLAVGVPGEDDEGVFFDELDAGAVNVFRGGPNGLAADGHQFWSQDSSGIGDSTGDLNEFGYSLAVGDFDGDQTADLAVGVPGETEGGASFAGAVNIIYGSLADGLTSEGNEYIHQDTPRIAGVPEFGDNFGHSLAAGDFNGDLRDDLIVGVPREDTNLTDVGAFHIIPGTANGLMPAANAPLVDVITEDSAGLDSDESSHAFFGASIVAADFDQDGFADLALGAPGTSGGFTGEGRGAVHTVYGANAPFQSSFHQLWRQGDGDNVQGPQGGERFGLAVATGDFNGDGQSDMVSGAPFRHLPTEQRWNKTQSGVVNVVYGEPIGLDINSSQIWTQDHLQHPVTSDESRGAEFADQFGSSLAVGDFNADGFDDLAIGSPHEDLAGKSDVGMVNIVYGSNEGLTPAIDLNDFFAARNEVLWQGDPDTADDAEAFDEFGHALTVGDFDDDGFDDLAVGVIGEEINAQVGRDSGAVHVFYGGASGFFDPIDGHPRDQLWTMGSANINVSMREEQFGTSLTSGDFDGNGVDDLAIGAPNSIPVDLVTNSGLVGIMYGSISTGLNAAGNHGLFGFGGTFNPQNQFGYSLAAGDINADGRDDLAVGAPFDDFPGFPPLGDVNDAGTVNVYYGAVDGMEHNQFDVWSQSNNGGATSAVGVSQAGDQFGFALTIADFDGDTFADLVVGVPEGAAATRAGEANLIHGSSDGLDATRQQVWSQESPGIVDTAQPADRFATSLAAGDFNADGAADLLVGVPFEDVEGIGDAGLVHTIYGELAVTLTGDFDGDGAFGVTDLDLLFDELGTSDPVIDLDGSGVVDNGDLTSWLMLATANDPLGRQFVRGDANLDGMVTGADFTTLAANFGSTGGWSHGNFVVAAVPGGGDINGPDFTALAASFGNSAVNAITRGGSSATDRWAPSQSRSWAVSDRVGRTEVLDLVFANVSESGW